MRNFCLQKFQPVPFRRRGGTKIATTPRRPVKSLDSFPRQWRGSGRNNATIKPSTSSPEHIHPRRRDDFGVSRSSFRPSNTENALRREKAIQPDSSRANDPRRNRNCAVRYSGLIAVSPERLAPLDPPSTPLITLIPRLCLFFSLVG